MLAEILHPFIVLNNRIVRIFYRFFGDGILTNLVVIQLSVVFKMFFKAVETHINRYNARARSS